MLVADGEALLRSVREFCSLRTQDSLRALQLHQPTLVQALTLRTKSSERRARTPGTPGLDGLREAGNEHAALQLSDELGTSELVASRALKEVSDAHPGLALGERVQAAAGLYYEVRCAASA